MSESYILSGDCGGTNTRLSLWCIAARDVSSMAFDVKCIPGKKMFAKIFVNENFESFQEICTQFLKQANCASTPMACVLACAGPIDGNTVRFTNVESGWEIDGCLLQKSLDIPQVKLINDFAALGYGLLTLRPSEYITLNDVTPDKSAPIATIGAGTGLGECFLTPSGNAYDCYACEGGHTDFAPSDDLEVEMLNYLKQKFNDANRISVERIISGIGLSNIYEFLSTKFPNKINASIHAKWEAANAMKGAVIGQNANEDGLCAQAVSIFVRAYGREAGNAALKYLPRGGMYITGGLLPKLLPFFTESSEFKDSFFDKGRVSSALNSVPLHLVLSDDLGERGAHLLAYQLLTGGGIQEKTCSWKSDYTCPLKSPLVHIGIALSIALSYYLSRR